MCGPRRNLPQSHTRSQTQLAWAVNLIRTFIFYPMSPPSTAGQSVVDVTHAEGVTMAKGSNTPDERVEEDISKRERAYEKSSVLQNLGTGFCQQFFKHEYRNQWYSLQVMCPETWRLTFYSFLCKTGIIP